MKAWREELGIQTPLVDLAKELNAEVAQAYDDNGNKIAARYYDSEGKIRISPLTTDDVSDQKGADYVYSILLIHELLHYSSNSGRGSYNPHFAMVYAAKAVGLTSSENDAFNAANKLVGTERDDAMSELASKIISNRCPPEL